MKTVLWMFTAFFVFAWAGIDEQIDRQRQTLAGLEETLRPLLQPYQIEDREIRIWISTNALEKVFQAINEQPKANRIVRFRMTECNRCPVKKEKDWFVEPHQNKFRAKLQIKKIEPVFLNQGLDLHLSLRLQVEGEIHGHFDPGSGGGVGAEVGVSVDVEDKLVARLEIQPQEQDWFRVEITPHDNQKIKTRLRVDLSELRKKAKKNLILSPFSDLIPKRVCLQTEFPIPAKKLYDADFPALFQEEGSIKLHLPGGIQEKLYQWRFHPEPVELTDRGLVFGGHLELDWLN